MQSLKRNILKCGQVHRSTACITSGVSNQTCFRIGPTVNVTHREVELLQRQHLASNQTSSFSFRYEVGNANLWSFSSKMRYHRTPNSFKTRHWAKLWQSNIPNLESLQTCMAKNTAFVAIDAEPWGDQSALIAEIALSLIYPFDCCSFLHPPKTISQLRSGLQISTYSIKISGREQGKGRERFQADNNQTVTPEEVESTLVNIVDAFQAILASRRESISNDHPAKLVLIGFDLGFEFRSMSTSYPLITSFFASWVDLQELVKDIAMIDRAPTLRDSLIAFGFEADRQAIGSIQKKHSSALDTLRMTALLVSLAFHQPGAVLKLQFTARRKWSPGKARGRYMGTGKLFNSQPPKPGEFHPFMAQVLLEGSSLNNISASELFNTFAEYDPMAVGNGCNKRREFLKGWISLPSLNKLDHFVKDVNGTESEHGGIWQAVSLYDPVSTPIRTVAELENFKKLRLQEVAEEKRAQRAQKKISLGISI